MDEFTATINRYLDDPQFYTIDEIAELMDIHRSHIEAVVAQRWEKIAQI